MALYLDSRDIAALATPEVTMRAAWQAVRCEQKGTTVLPARLDVDLPRGFLRVMPAALDSVMGVKVMTLVRGVGNRYLLLLYAQETGALIAVIDASEITRLRTAATTMVAGQILRPGGASQLGLIGSGFEAEGHLRAFAHAWPLETVRVFSPSADRCKSFAQRMSEALGIRVEPVATAAAALASAPVAVVATKSRVPVVSGDMFDSRAVVLSIGSTRPDLRELDAETFRRAAVVLVDSPQQVTAESGDVIEAFECGALHSDHVVAMADAELNLGDTPVHDDRDLRVFKSVGTALQDLALAEEILNAAVSANAGIELGDIAELKLSDNPRKAAVMPEATT